MTYLQEFQAQITARNYSKFLQLWEEYCTSDQVDVAEFLQFLQMVKNSEFAKPFGKLIETALPLWKLITDKNDSYNVLKALIDLQTTNSPALAELAHEALKSKYGQDPQFNEKIRIVGLRTRDQFQGALSQFDLLSHMVPGKFVYNGSGWGTGEVLDMSLLRQQLTVEFENVSGRKQLTFENAFKSLIPLQNDHFYARRFVDPDQFEKEVKEDPVGTIKGLLRDLGPQTAVEIKDLMCGLVIPEEEWTKWWQATRTKLKKDPLIESPETLRDPFRLRKAEITHAERLDRAITDKTDIDEIIQTAYSFLRDLPSLNKHPEVRDSLKEKLLSQLSSPDLTPDQELQICICLETQFDHKLPERETKGLIQKLEHDHVKDVVDAIDIVALKKRALTLIKQWREDWISLFVYFLGAIRHSALRDYILKELNQKETRQDLETMLRELLENPEKSPDCFVWYFQWLLSEPEGLPYGNKEGQCQFFESLLVLLSRLENRSDQRDFSKKIYNLLTGKRYEVVRQVMEGAPLHFVQEVLLLASKCHSLNEHDKQILRSLAAVVHPQLGKSKAEKEEETNHHILWTTEEAFLKIQDRIQHIGTVEIVENAREVEAARALGDLRENSEYKFAVERRSRLQGQLKTLSEQIKHARIITKNDISSDEVGVGSVVELADENGKKITYTILGPWDADADKNVLSFQSKLAQAMLGCKKGDMFQFRDEKFKILALKTFLDK